MKEILLITGNKNKLEEWLRLVPAEIELKSIDIDLEELQSDDPIEVVTAKAHKAFEVADKPVIVEDISASMDSLNGLPGPFVKFFVKRMGPDTLWQLAHQQETRRPCRAWPPTLTAKLFLQRGVM